MEDLHVNGESRPIVSLFQEEDDEEWCMNDQGERIEKKLDAALALLNQQEGERKARDREIAEIKEEQKGLELDLKVLEREARLERSQLRDMVNQARGSLKTFKWLASIGGTTGASAALYEVLRQTHVFGGG